MDIKKFVVPHNSTILDALKVIDGNKSGFAVIEKDSIIYAVITDGDVRRSLINGTDLKDKICNICNTSFKYINIDDNLADAVDIFQTASVNALPILDSSKKLKNILFFDVLQSLLLRDAQFDLSYDFLSSCKDNLAHQIHMRPWGFYKTNILNEFFQSKIIHIYPNQKLSLQSHKFREEYWTIINGTGTIQIGESTKDVHKGDTFFIPKDCKHRLTNTSYKATLIFTEVQLGTYFGEDDIHRFDDIYNRHKE